MSYEEEKINRIKYDAIGNIEELVNMFKQEILDLEAERDSLMQERGDLKKELSKYTGNPRGM